MPSYKEIVMDAKGMNLQAFTAMYRNPMLLGWRMLGGSLTKKAPLTAAYMKPSGRDGRSRRMNSGPSAGVVDQQGTLIYQGNDGGETAQNPLADNSVESCELERPYVFVIERADGEPGPVSIGRTLNSDVTINDYSISSNHAQLAYSDVAGFAHIKDMGSTNGTAVGTKRLEGEESEVLESGYWVTLGRVVCQFFSPKDLYAHITQPEEG